MSPNIILGETIMTYNVREDVYYANFISSKNLTTSTEYNYYKTLKKLSKAIGLPLKDIILNCKDQQDKVIEKIINHGTDEQGNIVTEKQVTRFDVNSPNSIIKQYFNRYIEYCKNKNNTTNTIFQDFGFIKTFLKFYSITYPQIEINREKTKWTPLKKTDIKFVMDDSTILHQSLISLLKDCGGRLKDVVGFVIGNFMEWTSDYHNFVDVDEFIDHAPQDMIGVIKFYPHKTIRFNLLCITCIGPETCNLILQNLRKIKNEYLPYINKKKGLNLKMSKNDALFGNKNKYYKGHLKVQSVSDIFARKNKKLREHHLKLIDEKITNGELSEEDRAEAIGNIPKFHAHGLRKFFQSTIAKNCGNLRICTLMEGHTSPIKTDPSYIKIEAEEVKEVYMSALPDLSLENVETKTYTSEARREMEAQITDLKNQNKELESKVKNKEDAMGNMEERLSKVEKIFKNVDELSDDEILSLFGNRKK